MLRRTIDRRLLEWKQRPHHKSLVVLGARQVGKTFSIRQFGTTQYPEMVEINFKENPSMQEVFAHDLDVDTLIMGLRFRFPEKQFAPGKTLIFLDEIQACGNALTSLKFWTDDQRYDVIASGSLLGIDHQQVASYPVGYTEFLRMYGLDFQEFLWAMGLSDAMLASLETLFRERRAIPAGIHTRMMRLFREYIATGGMPEVVRAYVETKDFRTVDRIQRELLQGYVYDIAHYASADKKVKAEKCYLSLSHQLLDKENHKFQYKEVETGGRAQKYRSSVEWLEKADMVRLCRLVTAVRYDLDDYAKDSFFRAYPSDLSLLMAMKDFGLKQHVVENTLEGNTKGGIYECAIADVLAKKGYRLFFYKDESSRQEIDFLIQKEGTVIPIEVKSHQGRAPSFQRLLAALPQGATDYRLTDGNLTEQTTPLYLAMFI